MEEGPPLPPRSLTKSGGGSGGTRFTHKPPIIMPRHRPQEDPLPPPQPAISLLLTDKTGILPVFGSRQGDECFMRPRGHPLEDAPIVDVPRGTLVAVDPMDRNMAAGRGVTSYLVKSLDHDIDIKITVMNRVREKINDPDQYKLFWFDPSSYDLRCLQDASSFTQESEVSLVRVFA